MGCTIVSAIERDDRRLSAEMAVRFALALDVSMDELLGPAEGKPKAGRKPSRKVLRRLEQIEALPPTQQTALLRTIRYVPGRRRAQNGTALIGFTVPSDARLWLTSTLSNVKSATRLSDLREAPAPGTGDREETFVGWR